MRLSLLYNPFNLIIRISDEIRRNRRLKKLKNSPAKNLRLGEIDSFELLEIIAKTSQKEHVIFDIGANIGTWTLLAKSLLPNSRIYAFEPISHNFNNLNRVIKLFGVKNVTSQKVALGEFTAEVEMVTPVQGGVIKQGLSKINDHDTPGRLEKVKIINLDSIPFKGRVTAIKVDVEGHELQVLKGAGKILSKDKPIIYCELWDSIRAEVVAYMQTYGYKSYIFDESLNKLVLYTTQEDCNFFFLK